MTIREFIVLFYFLPAVGFTIATQILFDRMLGSVNEKLPAAERWTRWKLFLTRSSNMQIPFLYNRYYPNGNLATLYWVCLGFSVLCSAGAFFCVSIAVTH